MKPQLLLDRVVFVISAAVVLKMFAYYYFYKSATNNKEVAYGLCLYCCGNM